MDIPASVVIRKMEEELDKLKVSVNASENTYREHAQVLKTYCDLLLDTKTEAPAPKVQHATVNDVHGRKGERTEHQQTPESHSAKKSGTVYDGGDNPESDSLFDF
ncbi:hypothetical protein CR203_05405 [Salipaludibacillus neizhouensis]|uniref:YwdI family protein n=1 Tax=Salipaludibacillus neizhouensis TaxID=885475 RepID=A0A3A9KE91_9BACI|nr:YwdI family protein [Salipaludibacillus neizhouensis]RKL67943.1 hypothetical protein CR203_05405 [Salipaludibacillus neizhouensis]